MKRSLILILIFAAGALAASIPEPYIGIFIEVPYEQVLKKLNSDYGVLLTAIVEDSPAEEAGLKVNMLVLEINSKKIHNQEDIVNVLKGKKPGDKLEFLILENGKKRKVKLTLAEKVTPDTPVNVFSVFFNNVLGVETQTLTPQLMEFFEVKNGLLVRTVIDGSPADKNGLKAGDIIIEAIGNKIENNNDLYSIAMDKSHKNGIEILTVRKGKLLRMLLHPDYDKFTETYSIDVNPNGNSVFVYSPEFTMHHTTTEDTVQTKSEIEAIKSELYKLQQQFNELKNKH